MKHDVGEQVHRFGQMLFQEGSVKHRALLVGKRVQVASHTLQAVDDVQWSPSLCAFEGGVLAEVRHTLLIIKFMACSCGNAIATVNHRRTVW